MSFQLPLDFQLRDKATLDRFVSGANAALLNALQCLATSNEPASIYISGPVGLGKTHLLQGTVRICEAALYIPLAMIEELSVEIFEGVEDRRVICIDDVDQVAANKVLEVALFSLLKRIKDQQHSIVLASTALPDLSGFELEDLLSRLNGCMQYQLQSPDEPDIREYIKQDVTRRGLEIGDDVIHWMLTHLPRDMKSLAELMNKLDIESLRMQRRITIPFIKGLL